MSNPHQILNLTAKIIQERLEDWDDEWVSHFGGLTFVITYFTKVKQMSFTTIKGDLTSLNWERLKEIIPQYLNTKIVYTNKELYMALKPEWDALGFPEISFSMEKPIKKYVGVEWNR